MLSSQIRLMVEYSPHKNLGAQFDNLQEIWNWFNKIYGDSVGITEDLCKEFMALKTMTGANEHAKLVDLYDRVTTSSGGAAMRVSSQHPSPWCHTASP